MAGGCYGIVGCCNINIPITHVSVNEFECNLARRLVHYMKAGKTKVSHGTLN